MYLVKFYLDDITWSTHVMDETGLDNLVLVIPGLDKLCPGQDYLDETGLDYCGLGQGWLGRLWPWTSLAWTSKGGRVSTG